MKKKISTFYFKYGELIKKEKDLVKDPWAFIATRLRRARSKIDRRRRYFDATLVEIEQTAYQGMLQNLLLASDWLRSSNPDSGWLNQTLYLRYGRFY